MKNIIAKLKRADLLGRGGANFPTGLKWEAVKKEKADKKYIICNASEGEPMVFKDKFILENHAEDLIKGIKIALETIDNSSAYIYLNKKYYPKFKKNLEDLSRGLAITLFEKPEGYICGEETTILNVIEGKRHEPRIKPPYPTQKGLFNCPTLVNNVETFYYIAKIAENKYDNTRFYSIEGDIKNKGVYEFPLDYSIEKILKTTNNYPDFEFFVQSGGGACGEILLEKELNKPVQGAGSIIVYDKKKTDLFSLMEKWADFFINGNCDKCVPCREGVYRVYEMIKKRKFDKKALKDISFSLERSSFCPLGKMTLVPFQTLINKVLEK